MSKSSFRPQVFGWVIVPPLLCVHPVFAGFHFVEPRTINRKTFLRTAHFVLRSNFRRSIQGFSLPCVSVQKTLCPVCSQFDGRFPGVLVSFHLSQGIGKRGNLSRFNAHHFTHAHVMIREWVVCAARDSQSASVCVEFLQLHPLRSSTLCRRFESGHGRERCLHMNLCRGEVISAFFWSIHCMNISSGVFACS